MIRRLAVTALAAALLVGGPALSAQAAMSDCPQSVQDYSSGVNPSYAAVRDWLVHASVTYDVPYPALWAIAYQESGWRQYQPDGHVLVSSDDVCGLGIMQVTADGSYTDGNKLRLATDYRYNIDEGARILRAKWDVSQQTPPPAGADPDDDEVVENWYRAICLYNGCPSDSTDYPERIAETLSDPFRRVPDPAIRSLVKPYPFTTPTQADPTYVFPAAFQARWGVDPADQVFVFYDHTTGVVSKTVQAPTHELQHVPAITVTYPYAEFGPDDNVTVCVQCAGWRLAAGLGTQGRAHWTNTILGDTSQSKVVWSPITPHAGLYRVSAYVPAIGDETLGTATYTAGTDTFTVDQNAAKNTWRALGDHQMGPGSKIVLGDRTPATAGQKVVADAVRASMITHLTIAAPHRTVDWGTGTGLHGRLTHVGAPDGSAGLAGAEIRVWRRRPGTTHWSSTGSVGTDAQGSWSFNLRADESFEYMAAFVRPYADMLSTTSGVVRVDSRVKVTASLSRTAVPRNTSVTLSTQVLPPHGGQYAYLQRYYDGAWHTSLWKALGPNGYAHFTFSKSVPGTYYYRTYKLADADHAAGWSPIQVLNVG